MDVLDTFPYSDYLRFLVTDAPYSKADVCRLSQAVEAKVLDNLSEQTTAEKSAAKTAQDIKALRKQGVNSSSLHLYNCLHHSLECAYSRSDAVAVAIVNCSYSCQMQLHAAAQMIGPSTHMVTQVICIHAHAAVHMAAVCLQPRQLQMFINSPRHQAAKTSCTPYAESSTLDACTMAATDSCIKKR